MPADVLQFPKLPAKPAAPAPTVPAGTLSDVMTTGLLKVGSKGDAVTELQAQLKLWGFDPIEVDGIFGQHTADAVSALQRKLGVGVDGQFGQVTRDAIKADLASSASVIRAWQGTSGLRVAASPAPGFLDKMKSLAKSPYVWVGAAAIGAGGYWWFKKSKEAAPAPAEPPEQVAGLEPYIPAELRVPTKRKRKSKKE